MVSRWFKTFIFVYNINKIIAKMSIIVDKYVQFYIIKVRSIGEPPP